MEEITFIQRMLYYSLTTPIMIGFSVVSFLMGIHKKYKSVRLALFLLSFLLLWSWVIFAIGFEYGIIKEF